MTTPRAALDFWFGAPHSPEHGKPREVWFKKSDAFDAEMRERFLSLYEWRRAGKQNTPIPTRSKSDRWRKDF